ncbi:MAG TPA: hypothetical protein VK970_18960, partial [Candidatus Methylacidiphilales bacterium]|nr:hypothetical protein [Candidatus Methylacidiphilales bacterium]
MMFRRFLEFKYGKTTGHQARAVLLWLLSTFTGAAASQAAQHLPSTEATPPPLAKPAKPSTNGVGSFSRAEAAGIEKARPEPVAKPAQPVAATPQPQPATIARKAVKAPVPTAAAVPAPSPASDRKDKEKEKDKKPELAAAAKPDQKADPKHDKSDKAEKATSAHSTRPGPQRDKTTIELAQPALPLHPAKPSSTALSAAKLGKNPPKLPKEKEPTSAPAAPALPARPGSMAAIPMSENDLPKGLGDPLGKPVLPKLPPRTAPPTGSLPRNTASTTPLPAPGSHGQGEDAEGAPSTTADLAEPTPMSATGPVMPKLLPPSAVAVDPTRPLKQLLPTKPQKIMAALPVDKTAPVYMPPLAVNPATRVMAPLPVVPVAEPNYKVTIPELVDDVPPPGPSDPLMEPRQKQVLQRNLAALRTMRMADPSKLKEVCRAKISSATTPSSLKLLYASLLTLAGEPAGRDYLRVSLTNVNGPALADTMWMFSFIALESDVLRGGQRPDLSWAEDLMVSTLKYKRSVSTARIFPTVPGKPVAGPLQSTMPATVQVRELAVMTGRFQDILAAARSRRLPSVLVDWARENPPPSDL